MSRRTMLMFPLLLAGCLFGGGCASSSPVEVFLTNIEPLPSTLFEQRARLDLRLQNLGETPISATGLNVALKVNDRRLASGVSGESFTVPRLGEATASVVVSTSLFDTVRQILELRDREVFTYNLSGRLMTSGMDRRFNKSGEISRTQLQPLARER